MTAFFIFWVLCLAYFLYATMGKTSEAETALKHELEGAKMDIKRVESENKALRELLKNIQEKDAQDNSHPPDLSQAVSRALDGPSLQYEVLRRQTKRDVNEMWWYVRANLESVIGKKGINPELESHLKNVVADTQHHQKAVLADLHHMYEHDGYETFRKREAQDLSDLVQKRIKSLQNPQDCQSAKKLLCNLNKGCGYGCQIHHAIYCFIVAYGQREC
jgi:glycoprotein 6-alpha-L-fucosyltransferase